MSFIFSSPLISNPLPIQAKPDKVSILQSIVPDELSEQLTSSEVSGEE
uniref:Uncharacterized protein n=1 Tax=Arundo donax TaxID=35708 RepID=A0A0A9GCJ2_ARUDO